MAKAKYTKKKNVKLTMGQETARTLYAILATVGGCPDNSPRKYASQVFNALEAIFGYSYDAGDAYKAMDISSGIYFNDYKKEETSQAEKPLHG